MIEIALDIQDTSGRVTTVIGTEDMPLRMIADLARDSLALPLVDRQGRKIDYALYHTYEGQFLSLEWTIARLEISSATRLRILPRSGEHFFEFELLTDPNPGMLFPLEAGKEATLGREFGNNIVIRHRAVSRQHGVLTWEDGFHLYLDLGSANGSWINNYPVTQPTPIANGDLLNLGQSVTLMYRERPVQRGLTESEADHVMEGMKVEPSRTGLVSIPKGEVYITYSQGQRHLMEAILQGLDHAGLKAWVDEEDIVSTVQRSNVMIAILSREAVNSVTLQSIWEEYAAHRKPVLPVLFEPCRVPIWFEAAPYIVEYRYDDTKLAGDVLEALYYLMT